MLQRNVYTREHDAIGLLYTYGKSKVPYIYYVKSFFLERERVKNVQKIRKLSKMLKIVKKLSKISSNVQICLIISKRVPNMPKNIKTCQVQNMS